MASSPFTKHHKIKISCSFTNHDNLETRNDNLNFPNFFCFSNDYVIELRKHHRILGVLISSLPNEKLSSQATSLRSLPLSLSPIEAFIGIKYGFLELGEYKSTSEESKEIISIASSIENIRINHGLNMTKPHLIDTENKKSTIISIPTSIESSKLISNSNQPNSLQWHSLCESSIESIWNRYFIESPKSKLRLLQLQTFESLWKNGYFVQVDSSHYSVHFIVYSADPFVIHAENLVMCILAGEKFKMSQLVSISRLATNTKKQLMIATGDYKNESIDYRVWIERKEVEGELLWLKCSWQGTS